jgi:hypothetical protein
MAATGPFDGMVAMAAGNTGSPATRIFLRPADASFGPRQNVRPPAVSSRDPAFIAGLFLPPGTGLPLLPASKSRKCRYFGLARILLTGGISNQEGFADVVVWGAQHRDQRPQCAVCGVQQYQR